MRSPHGLQQRVVHQPVEGFGAQRIGRVVALDRVYVDVARAVDCIAAREPQILHKRPQFERYRRAHRVDTVVDEHRRAASRNRRIVADILLDNEVREIVDAIRIVARAPDHRIRARSAIEQIVAGAARQAVVALQAGQRVVAGVAGNEVVCRVARPAERGAALHQGQRFEVASQHIVEARYHLVDAFVCVLDD